MVLIHDNMLKAPFKDFSKKLKAGEHSYSSMSTLRTFLVKAYREEPTPELARKIHRIQNAMKGSIGQEGVSSKRRVPGTGTKVEVVAVYKDTPENRKRERVGQQYTKSHYEGAEYTDYRQTKMRRLRVPRVSVDGKPPRRNHWIEAMRKAKEEMNAPALVIVRKEVVDPSDEGQVMGHKVYVRAREIMEQLRAAEAAEKAQAEEAQATQAIQAAAKIVMGKP